MNTTTAPESEYQRGFRDGIEYIDRLDDEIAVMSVIFGSKPETTEDDLSPRQLKMLRRMQSESTHTRIVNTSAATGER